MNTETLFISYAREDAEFAQRLRADLELRGVKTWIDEQGIHGGDDWRNRIATAIEGCKGMLVILSPDSMAKDSWVHRELAFADGEGKRILPLLYRECELPREFRLPFGHLQRVDFSHGSYEANLAKLLASIEQVLGLAVTKLSSAEQSEPRRSEHQARKRVTKQPTRKGKPGKTSCILGIDLGTTNSVVAVFEAGRLKVVPNAEGEISTPSVVALGPDGHGMIVGTPAKRQATSHTTVSSVPRLVGRRFSSPAIQDILESAPYETSASAGDGIFVWLDGRPHSLSDILAALLSKLKHDAEIYLDMSVTQAVIAVPALFTQTQRRVVVEAAQAAELEAIELINAPTAACLAYGWKTKADRTIAVCHLGGGVTGVVALDMGDGVFEVRAYGGDTLLGGDDFDQRIVNWVADEFQKEHDIDLRLDRWTLQRLKAAAEMAKIDLSAVKHTEINLPYITADASGPKHLNITLTRRRFEQLTEELAQRLVECCHQTLEDAQLGSSGIDEVLLVGGMTRVPMIQEALRSIFGKEPHRGVNPNEAVALGAAIRAGTLSGDVKDILLLDATPLTLSIETLGGVATPLIPRNTTIPVLKSLMFSTAVDNQKEVEVHVVEGEQPMAVDNESLGRFILSGIPPAPHGEPQIEVTFYIEANGLLQMSAQEKVTGVEIEVKI